MSLSVTHCLQLEIFAKDCRKNSLFLQKNLNVKRPQLSIKKQFGPLTDSSSGLVAENQPNLKAKILQLAINTYCLKIFARG